MKFDEFFHYLLSDKPRTQKNGWFIQSAAIKKAAKKSGGGTVSLTGCFFGIKIASRPR